MQRSKNDAKQDFISLHACTILTFAVMAVAAAVVVVVDGTVVAAVQHTFVGAIARIRSGGRPPKDWIPKFRQDC